MAINNRDPDSDGDDEWGEGKEVVVLDRTNSGPVSASIFGADSSVNGVVEADTGGRQSGIGNWSVFVASLANLAISYNVVNIGLALELIGQAHTPATETQETLVSTGAILGMVIGQVLFGMAGDFLGRQRALMYTLVFCAIGAVGSAFSFDVSGGPGIYQQLVYWRLLLGAGAGGVYPLAANMARSGGIDLACLGTRRCGRSGAMSTVRSEEDEEAGEGLGVQHAAQKDTGSTAVAFLFSMQGVGYLGARFTGFLLVVTFCPSQPDVAWRLLLGLGAVLPVAIVVMVAVASARARRYALLQSGEGGGEGELARGAKGRGGSAGGSNAGAMGPRDGGGSSPREVWRALHGKDNLVPKLIGTAGSWFLFDMTFYGNQLYEADVLNAVFGNRSELSLAGIAAQDSLLALIALPGYFVAVALVGKLGPRLVQVQGFVMMAVLYVTIGLAFVPLTRDHAYALMLLYSLTFFFSNFGPNSTTFLLPSLTFPDEVRGSLNGVSAAAGKVGALVGSFLFEPASALWGVGTVLVICAGVSLAGGALTLAFVNFTAVEDPEARLELSSGISAGMSQDSTFERNRASGAGRGHGAQTTAATINGSLAGSGGNDSRRSNGRSLSKERTPLAPTDHRRKHGQKSKNPIIRRNGNKYSMVGEMKGANHHGTFDDGHRGGGTSNGQTADLRGDRGVSREGGGAEYRSVSRRGGGGVEGEVHVGSSSGFGDVGSDDSDGEDGDDEVTVVVVGDTRMGMV